MHNSVYNNSDRLNSLRRSTTVPTGQVHLVDVKIIFILSDTLSFLWVQTNRMVTRGTLLKIIII
jgi:hypothetical protein